MRAVIVTPAPPRSRRGNRITALRWAKVLRGLAWQVSVRQEWRGEPCDLLVALHAVRSAPSVARYREEHPSAPLVVALTGTDLYGGLDTAAARATLKAATRLVVLHPHAAEALPAEVRAKTRAIVQGARCPGPHPERDGDAFEVCVLGHLRPVKDPFRAAEAARALPARSRVRILHAGAALSAEMRERARLEEACNPRYRWLGELPHPESLSLLSRCRLLVLSSRAEGGANAICEALACDVPVLASDIAGSRGLLGADYPGLFPVGDTAALAALLLRCEREREFLDSLERACRAQRSLVDPAREREAWRSLLRELASP